MTFRGERTRGGYLFALEKNGATITPSKSIFFNRFCKFAFLTVTYVTLKHMLEYLYHPNRFAFIILMQKINSRLNKQKILTEKVNIIQFNVDVAFRAVYARHLLTKLASTTKIIPSKNQKKYKRCRHKKIR